MKVRLLKRLRRKYIVEIRNSQYRIFDIDECAGGIYNHSEWTTKQVAIDIRRKWILKEANRYKNPKKYL